MISTLLRTEARDAAKLRDVGRLIGVSPAALAAAGIAPTATADQAEASILSRFGADTLAALAASGSVPRRSAALVAAVIAEKNRRKPSRAALASLESKSGFTSRPAGLASGAPSPAPAPSPKKKPPPPDDDDGDEDAPPPASKTCASCLAENRTTALCCANCGARLKDAAPAPDKPAASSSIDRLVGAGYDRRRATAAYAELFGSQPSPAMAMANQVTEWDREVAARHGKDPRAVAASRVALMSRRSPAKGNAS